MEKDAMKSYEDIRDTCQEENDVLVDSFGLVMEVKDPKKAPEEDNDPDDAKSGHNEDDETTLAGASDGGTTVSPQTHPYNTKHPEILRHKIISVTADRKRSQRPPTTLLSHAITAAARLVQPKLLQQQVSRLCFASRALNVTRALDLVPGVRVQG
ncbi:hypothetical protein Cob_v008852 [Colletotrichum orbiculare MAFF 240422]|uniref:Uncharacterized protein n=1 Tax=Colletotrichum orbiculare (strain 104-T / ATCC 96160 / CBS 514.97 / LARS 414 / MAFF 240422) TaxID=1213857 RepID=N4UPB9_COLOR|nr:hypothetical protein Cob_v008852 [Colletotrichum orbiculare MAFF 240422]